MNIRELPAIDVHGHYGFFARPNLPKLTQQLGTADAATVASRAKACRIQWTIVSPLSALMPRNQANAVSGNDEAACVVPKTPGILQWVVVNPLQPATYQQAEQMLKQPTCIGIKIHPEEHGYAICDYGNEIFQFAATQSTVVLAHTGESRSLPEDFVPFADQFPEMTLILAHIGNSENGDRTLQVRAVQQSKNENIYADTSSALSITPGLIEWAVKEIGPSKILFGTDTPLYSTAMHRERINSAEIDDRDKRLILFDNAMAIPNWSIPTSPVAYPNNIGA